MPRYLYECIKCSHSWELLEGWDASRNKRCPECRSKALRIPRAPAIVFKGKGFYATDNRSSKFESRRKEEEGGSSGDGESSEGGSSDGESGDAASGESGSGKKNGGSGKKSSVAPAKASKAKK